MREGDRIEPLSLRMKMKQMLPAFQLFLTIASAPYRTTLFFKGSFQSLLKRHPLSNSTPSSLTHFQL